MSNVLIFEDSNERIKHFKKALMNHTCKYAKDFNQAINILSAEKFDIAFLDHDIKGSDKDGTTLVKWIVDNNLNLPIIYHSFNPVAVRNMQSIIKGPYRAGIWLAEVYIINSIIKQMIEMDPN